MFLKVYPLQYVANKQFLFGVAYHYTNKQAIEIQAGPLIKEYFCVGEYFFVDCSFLPAIGGSFHLNHRYILNSKKKSKSLMYINNQLFAKYVKLKDFRNNIEGGFDSLYQLKYVMGYKLLFGMEFPLYRSVYLDINTGVGLRFRRTNTVRFYRQIGGYGSDGIEIDRSKKLYTWNWFGLTPHFQLGLGYKIR